MNIIAVDEVKKEFEYKSYDEAKTEKREQEKNDRQLSDNEIRDSVEKANKLSSVFGRQLSFSVHSESGLRQIKVTDQESGDILREIPETEFLDFIGRLKEAEGLIFDEKI